MRTRIRNQGHWRKAGKHGVSPIIATILLVAITVVLAAVLYVLISGLTRGPGNTPIGSALAVSSGTATTKSTWFNETFSIQSASTGVTGTSLKFQLLTSGGSITTLGTVTLIDVSGCSVGFYTVANGWTQSTAGLTPAGAFGGVTGACGAALLSPTSQISSGDELIVTSTATLSGAGNTLSIIGTGSYSGSVSASIP